MWGKSRGRPELQFGWIRTCRHDRPGGDKTDKTGVNWSISYEIMSLKKNKTLYLKLWWKIWRLNQKPLKLHTNVRHSKTIARDL